MCCIPPVTAPRPKPEQKACGTTRFDGEPNFRIVGGTVAKHGEFPWQVTIRGAPFGGHHCGGAILNENWVLTATHCFMWSDEPDEYSVVSGDHYLYLDDGTEQKVEIERIIKHESFNKPKYANDIALIKLKQPLVFDNFTRPICLPTPGDIHEKLICTASGWGDDKINGGTEVLYKVNLPIVPFDTCKAYYKDRVHTTNICGGFKSGDRDACQGDSGGPFSCLLNNGHWVLGGIVSWGDGCAYPDIPGIFSDVTSFLPWIDENMK